MKKIIIITAILLNFFWPGAIFANCYTGGSISTSMPLTVYFGTRNSHSAKHSKIILIKRIGYYSLYKINRRFARDIYVIYHRNKGIIKRTSNFKKAMKKFRELTQW